MTAARTAWVTGAASGIGRATATLLATRGYRVLCLDRDAAGLAGFALAQPLDVTDEAAWAAVADLARQQLGRLDAAVHCAGISRTGLVADMSFADWRAVLAVNLDGVFLGTRAALALMRELGTGGAIVNVSSASGLKALPEASAYCASKAAVNMLTRCAAKEGQQLTPPVRANSICPGGVKTPIWRTVPFFQELIARTGSEEAAFAAMAPGPNDRFAEPEEIARAILYLLGDDAGYITGTELVIDAGFTA